jgi:hypothetical protein
MRRLSCSYLGNEGRNPNVVSDSLDPASHWISPKIGEKEGASPTASPHTEKAVNAEHSNMENLNRLFHVRIASFPVRRWQVDLQLILGRVSQWIPLVSWRFVPSRPSSRAEVCQDTRRLPCFDRISSGTSLAAVRKQVEVA